MLYSREEVDEQVAVMWLPLRRPGLHRGPRHVQGHQVLLHTCSKLGAVKRDDLQQTRKPLGVMD